MNRVYQVLLQPITPIHIGSGESLDPLEYIVKKEGDQNRLYYYNSARVMIRFSEKDPEEATERLKSGNLQWILDSLINTFDPADRTQWTSSYLVNNDFAGYFMDSVGKPSNETLLMQFIRSSQIDQPFIPGSSLKGALRTGILSSLIGQKWNPGALYSRNKGRWGDRNLQAEVLNAQNKYGNFAVQRDPFKYLKVGDMPFPAKHLDAMQVNNLKTGKRSSAIPFWCEVLDHSKVEEPITGRIILSEFGRGRFIMSAREIFMAVNQHYRNAWRKDEKWFRSSGRGDVWVSIDHRFEKLQPDECMLRIGRGTGRNSLIYASRRLPDPFTRNLIGDLPLGWCKLKFRQTA